MSYEILVLSKNLSDLGKHIATSFEAETISSIEQVSSLVTDGGYKALVLDLVMNSDLDLGVCEELLKDDLLQDTPLVVLSSSLALKDKVKALEVGCDDLIDANTDPDEACARITRSIFHQIANSQLSQRLCQATETARNAMVDNSDLGANIQFLLKVHNTDNLDQLGQQFFSTIQRYGLSCSLQMRTDMGVKDMEASGMAKDLESQLLFQLKDNGRYVDFGRRSVINYDRVSLLIKNMPTDDPDKYGAIKDNTFCLVQGINSRILSLEDRHKLLKEKDSLRKLSTDVKDVIGGLKHSYQDVMCKIVNEVEGASEQLLDRLPTLVLSERDEEFIEKVTEELLLGTNRVFNDGLKVDDLFSKLEEAVQHSLDSAQAPSETVGESEPLDSTGDDDIELF